MNRFPDKSRVCFVGDSITHIGVFIKHIVGHYRKLFPGSGVEFYNCGIAGGYLGNTLAVFDGADGGRAAQMTADDSFRPRL